MNKVENANFITYFLFFTIPLLFSTMAVAKMDSLWKSSGEPSDIWCFERTALSEVSEVNTKTFSSSKYDLNTWFSYIRHVATNVLQLLKQDQFIFILDVILMSRVIKGSRMGHSVKVSLWCVTLSINTRFRFFNFRISNC